MGVFNIYIYFNPALGSEIVPSDDAPLQTRQRISTNTDDGESSLDKISESPPYEDSIPSKLERTPSMKILISTRAPKSPATQRSTAIVRVNSKSSGRSIDRFIGGGVVGVTPRNIVHSVNSAISSYYSVNFKIFAVFCSNRILRFMQQKANV